MLQHIVKNVFRVISSLANKKVTIYYITTPKIVVIPPPPPHPGTFCLNALPASYYCVLVVFKQFKRM